MRFRSIIKVTTALSLILVLATGFISFSSASVSAVDDITKSTCEGVIVATGGKSLDTSKDGTISDGEYEAGKDQCSDADGANFSNIIKSVINILSVLVGAVSVIMLIIGGFRYIISNGDSNSTKAAKDTIMYALIGLIIVLFAQVIIRFVWTKAGSSTTTTAAPSNPVVVIRLES